VSTPNTVVINAAGTGSRIGLNIPKSMIQVNGKSLIQRQLDQLCDVENIIAVVGFRGRELSDLIWQIRRDVTIVINHNYQRTGSAESFVLGSKIATSRVLSLDGDLLVETSDLSAFVNSNEDLVGVAQQKSKLPVLVEIQNSAAQNMGFDLISDKEWTGLLSIERKKALNLGSAHIFEGLKQFLPIKTMAINCFEIDEPEDILNAEKWLNNLESRIG
jgi:choline kinase